MIFSYPYEILVPLCSEYPTARVLISTYIGTKKNAVTVVQWWRLHTHFRTGLLQCWNTVTIGGADAKGTSYHSVGTVALDAFTDSLVHHFEANTSMLWALRPAIPLYRVVISVVLKTQTVVVRVQLTPELSNRTIPTKVQNLEASQGTVAQH